MILLFYYNKINIITLLIIFILLCFLYKFLRKVHSIKNWKLPPFHNFTKHVIIIAIKKVIIQIKKILIIPKLILKNLYIIYII